MKLFLLLFFVNCFNVFANEDKIIIIGAGPSGIGTASKLLENGIDNILILEAESRIGGRVNTVVFDGRTIDLGAEWCHGQKDNVVYETLKKLNLLNLLHHDDFSRQFYSSSRTNISLEFSTELFAMFEDIIFNIDFVNTTESLGAVLKQKYIETISKKYENDSEKLYIARLALEAFRHAVLSLEGSFSWDDIRTDSEYIECEGDQQLAWKNGYGQFLDILTKKYPNPKDQLPIDDKIHFNKEVIKITYGEKDPPIKILCSDNSSYTAKHVIITTSVGVLKEKAEHLFEPKLPESKIRGIRNIGFGAVMKVFITFDTKWWGNLRDFLLIWTEEDRASARSKFPHGPTNPKGESWIVEQYGILAISNSNILEVWFTGDMVPIIETMDENILKNGIYFTLNLFLGHLYRIPEPQKLLRSNWHSNPHFRGTYSYSAINSTGDDVRELEKPILNSKQEPIIQFAGEATNVVHHSTVHGAVESGFREADRLVKLYKKT